MPASAFAAFGLLGLGFCRLTGSHWVMFAITSHGLVKCRLDLLGRPRSVLGRSPAAAPEVLQRPLGWRRIALADTTVWVKYSLDPVLIWMRQYADDPDERPPTAARGLAALWTATVGIGSAAAGLAALVGLVIWSSR